MYDSLLRVRGSRPHRFPEVLFEGSEEDPKDVRMVSKRLLSGLDEGFKGLKAFTGLNQIRSRASEEGLKASEDGRKLIEVVAE